MDVTLQTQSVYSAAAVTVAFLLVGCSDGPRVGVHQYRVPTDHLVSKSSYPFFLPALKYDGFIFVLNPSAPRTTQRTVQVQQRSAICARARGADAYVNSAICAPQTVEWKGGRWLKSGHETFWTYSPETPSGSRAPFVNCFALQMERHPGLCHATLPYNDLAVIISLNDDEMPALEDTYNQAVSSLRSWER